MKLIFWLQDKSKIFRVPFWIRLPVQIVGSIIGAYLVIQTWVIKNANTVVEPVSIKLHHLEGAHDKDIKNINEKFDIILHQNSLMFQEMIKNKNQ